MIGAPRRYREYLEQLAESGALAAGEITPAYCTLTAEGFAAVVKLLPEAKLIFIMRDPVNRHISQLQFAKQSEQDSEKQSRFYPNKRLVKALDNPLNALRSDYPRTLGLLDKYLPADQVCTLFYENLFNPHTSNTEIRRLNAFLGFSHIDADISLRVNQSNNLAFSDNAISMVRNRLGHVYDYVAARYGTAAPEGWNW